MPKKRKYPVAPRATVEVDEATIQAAIPNDSSHCMIAEAVKAAFPGAIRVSVDLQTIRFSDPVKRLRYVYLTPRAAQVALIRFDGGERPDPFSMRLQGGQVTAMATYRGVRETPEEREERVAKQRTSRQQEARYHRRAAGQMEMSLDEEQAQAQTLSRTSLDRAPGAGKDEVPTRVGGQRPPVMTFARRRTFGIRALERLDPSGVATITY
jgi:hypothetical protein